ncbi:MAG: RsmE family RNA methyltransferase [Eubacteriales bacterium]|nr:RsmE family RNA methyltransferase [Eubacteriales bacterium]
MKRFFVNQNLQLNKRYKIEGVEHNHLKNVLRLSEGDEIMVVCGDEFDYLANIIKITKGDTEIEIVSKSPNLANPKSDVTVFQALVKSENMSLIVQKLTELGVKSFVPFLSEFITSKDKFNKSQKLQEISNQSVKQCKRSIPMQVSTVKTFDEILKDLEAYDIIIFANECEKNAKLGDLNLNPQSKVAIIIGSEGGFSSVEIDKLKNIGAKSISLGKRILRAETASIALTSCVMYLLGEWDYE